MEKEDFKRIMIENLKEINIYLSDFQLEQFYNYMNILIEWNKFMNLTGITDPKEIIIKHFIDSLTVLDKIDRNNTIIDVGTGAGFPGIPIKIASPDTEVSVSLSVLFPLFLPPSNNLRSSSGAGRSMYLISSPLCMILSLLFTVRPITDAGISILVSASASTSPLSVTIR